MSGLASSPSSEKTTVHVADVSGDFKNSQRVHRQRLAIERVVPFARTAS